MNFGERLTRAAANAVASAAAAYTGCAPNPSASAQGKTRQDELIDVASWNMDRNATKNVGADGVVDWKKLDDTRKDLTTLLKKSQKKCIIGVQELGGALEDKVEAMAEREGYRLVRGGRC
jgi:hypothetical protein